MNIQKFINRTDDLEFLEEAYKGGKSEFMIIYGRRRMGKTELIKEFCKNKKHVYYLSNKLDDSFQLQEILKRTAALYNERVPKIDNWLEFFEYIGEKADEEFVLAIDEFPYLVEVNKAIPSIFQAGWDEILKKSRIFLILCGSSISMMERHTLSYKSPLYGRRTGQIRIKPLSFEESSEFFRNTSLLKRTEFYSITNGTPAYLVEFDPSFDTLTNIERKVLGAKKPLYEEVEFLLNEELRETRNYFSILKAISFGRTKINDIVTFCNLERNKVARYLDTLIRLDIVKRELPITEKHPSKSRKGLYKIKDNFFNFWFRFVFPNKSDIEEGNLSNVLNIIKENLNQYVSFAFEGVCREFMQKMNREDRLPFTLERIGRWWSKGNEMDLVGVNKKTRDILFCECKWQDKVNPWKILADLQAKAELVQWNNDKRREHFAIFARSFMNRDVPVGVMIFDLNDMEKGFKQGGSAQKQTSGKGTAPSTPCGR